MARLALTLFGGFHARLAAGAALTLPTRKAQALLAYLAVPLGQTHSRGQCAALLWGDIKEESARASLRQALFAIRKALGRNSAAILPLAGDNLALERSAVGVDVATFERLIADGRPKALEQAASLYQGDFLAGFAVNESAFEEWLVTERERLRELALDTLGKLLAQQQRKAATGDAAVHTALKLLALDPLQEPVHRTLMRLHAERGRRGAALRQYQHCVTVLQRELGVEPEAETKRLYQQLLRQGPSRVAAGGSTPPVEVPAAAGAADRRSSLPSEEGALIGRYREVGWLSEALTGSAGGAGRLAAVVGEAGIGKSRLVAETVAHAARLGARVLLSRAYESEQVLPFGPWVDALRSARVVDELKALAPAWQAQLSRLVPELGKGSAGPGGAAADYLQLFESVAEAIRHLAARQPLLLVLEDVHWADDMSLRLLAFLGRRISGWPVLVVVTVREEELPDVPALRRTLEELEREGHLARLALGPLSRSDTLVLVRHQARTGSDETTLASLGAQVWMVSEGNPLVVVEMVQAQAEGAAPLEQRSLRLPERVREIVGRRLERLSPRGQTLATVAAVIGREFEFVLLQRAARLGDEEAAEGVEELVRRRILNGVGDDFGFTHERIREVAYASLIGVRRRALHAQVGAALEQLHAGRLEPVYDRLAHHYLQAEDAAKAVEYLTRFARKATRTYAHEDAVRAYSEALRQLETSGGAEADARRLDIVPRVTRSLMFLGRFEEARDLLLSQCGRVEAVDSPSLAGQYYLLLAHVYGFLGDRQKTAESARAAIAAAERAEDETTVGKALYVLAMEGWWSGDPHHGIAHGRRAVALLERATERWWLGQAHFAIAANCVLLGDFDTALAAATNALAIGDALGDPRVQTPATWITGTIHALRGDWDDGVAAGRRSLEYSSDPLNRADALGWLGLAYLERGDVAEAIDVLEQSVEHWSRFRVRSVQGGFRILLGHAHLMRGDVDRAARLAEEGVALTYDTGYLLSRGWGERLLALTAQHRNDRHAARTLLEQALGTFTAISAGYEAARTALLLAEICARLGDRPTAERMLAEARQRFATLKIPRYAVWTETLAGRLGLTRAERAAAAPAVRLPRWA